MRLTIKKIKVTDRNSYRVFISIRTVFMILFVFLSCHAFAGEEAWMNEYNRICANTQVAGSLSAEQIEDLIVKCNALLKEIEASQSPKKKLFIFRIEKCRNFYQYISESNKDGGTDQ